MAYSYTQISDADVALFEADYPVIIPYNKIKDSTQLPRLDGSFNWTTDEAAASMPTKYAYNDHTMSVASIGTSKVYTGFFSRLDSETIDSAFVAMSPNSQIPSYVRLLISNVYNFVTGENIVYDGSPTISPKNRFYPFYSVPTGEVYYQVNNLIYWMFDPRYSTVTSIEYREVWLGERIQLQSKPLRPVDVSRRKTSYKDFTSDGGICTRYVLGSARQVVSLKFNTGSATDVAQYRSIWSQSNYGQDPIVFCAKPYSEPENAGLFKITNQIYDMPLKGPFERHFVLELEEQGG